MRIPVVLTSPLAGTAAVCAGLAVLAVPLHRLTSAPRAAQVAAAPVHGASASATLSVLRLKLLAPAARVTASIPGGAAVLDLSDVPAGESEHDTVLALDEGVCELEFTADFGGAPAETAVFLTVMPDGMEGKTLFVTGSGVLRDILRFEWPHHHE